jgi:lactate permease
MLMAAGMKPLKSAVVSLLANTAPVAFGAMGAPIIALAGAVSSTHPEITTHVLSQMAGRQTPFVAFIVPLVLVFLVDGIRGVKQTWPVALVAGAVFGVAQFITANYITVEITDVVASLVTIAAVLAMLRVWKPSNPLPLEKSALDETDAAKAAASGKLSHYPEITATGGKRLWGAIAPYAIIVIVFSISQIPAVKAFLLSIGQIKFPWPILSGAPDAEGKVTSLIVNAAGNPVSTIFTFDHIRATGTLLLLSGIITAIVYKIKPADALKAYGGTLKQLRFTIITVLSVLALAYVMNLSGQTASLGFALASVGALFALMSPLLGWIGVAITGSDTSSNALFGLLQVTAAEQAGLNPVLMAASNSSGGVMGKMVSPQNLAVAAAAVGMVNKEGEIFRKVVLWSLALLAYFTILVALQAGPLAWMVPTP